MAAVTTDARTQPRADDDAPAAAPTDGTAPGAVVAEGRAARRRAAATDGADREDPVGAHEDGPAREEPRRRSGRGRRPAVVVLGVLLLLLLGAVGFLWATRPSASSVGTADYVGVLTQGRQDVVDLTSFDYQTIDQDVAQVRAVSVGELQKDSVDLLQKGRQQFTDQQVVVNTEVVSAAVTQAGNGTGRLVLVIQSTQRTKASTTPKVSRYRIQADLTEAGSRWLLSGITGR
jgi:Mce-associated membrane protein